MFYWIYILFGLRRFGIINKKSKIYKVIRPYLFMEIKVVLEKQEEGGYTVYAPSLTGCISQGETKQEALKNIKEAIELYLEVDENEVIVYEGEIATVKV